MAMDDHDGWMIYGAYGFTGALIARRAASRGLRPVLAGRDRSRLEALAGELSLPFRPFGLGDPARLDASLDGLRLVLHAAGPYSRTAAPMLAGCLRKATSYLDLTGETSVIARTLAEHDSARRAGVVLVPSVGFDVVPTDCLAVRLVRELPGAERLELAIAGAMTPSPGTALTAVEGLGDGFRVLRGGEIVRLDRPIVRRLSLGGEDRTLLSVGLADLVTAHRSTGIGHITVSMQVDPWFALFAGCAGRAMPLLGRPSLQRLLARLVARGATGPSAEQRRSRRMWIWGRVEAADGSAVEGRVETPETYETTVEAALECALRVLRGEAAAGATTPGAAFGPELLEALPGVSPIEVRLQA